MIAIIFMYASTHKNRRTTTTTIIDSNSYLHYIYIYNIVFCIRLTRALSFDDMIQ